MLQLLPKFQPLSQCYMPGLGLAPLIVPDYTFLKTITILGCQGMETQSSYPFRCRARVFRYGLAGLACCFCLSTELCQSLSFRMSQNQHCSRGSWAGSAARSPRWVPGTWDSDPFYSLSEIVRPWWHPIIALFSFGTCRGKFLFVKKEKPKKHAF